MTSVHSARYRQFRNRLKEARLAAGLTQIDAARALHRHQSWVSKCESGERRVDVLELEVFAKLYRRPLTFFLR
jgi:transcriptional regulator with XRE-family HTH domain